VQIYSHRLTAGKKFDAMGKKFDAMKRRADLDDDAYIEEDEIQIDVRKRASVHHSMGVDEVTDKEFNYKPDAVTESLAEAVWDEFLIDVEDCGIEIVPDKRLSEEKFEEKYGGEEE